MEATTSCLRYFIWDLDEKIARCLLLLSPRQSPGHQQHLARNVQVQLPVAPGHGPFGGDVANHQLSWSRSGGRWCARRLAAGLEGDDKGPRISHIADAYAAGI